MPLALRSRTSSGRFCFPLGMTMMRRDRFFLVFTLAAVFSADLYFILLPKLQRMGQRSVRPCSCSPDNITLPQHGGLATPPLSNWTSAQQLDVTRSEPVGTGSKLENLFSHPLYSIQTPELAPDERLLGTGQLMEYYKKKVTRWERSVHHASPRFNNIVSGDLIPSFFDFAIAILLFFSVAQLYCERIWLKHLSENTCHSLTVVNGAGSLTLRPNPQQTHTNMSPCV